MFWSHEGNPFYIFQLSHILILSGLIILWICLILFRKQLKDRTAGFVFKLSLTVLGLFFSLLFYIWMFTWNEFDIRWSLPIELCDLCFFVSLLSLWINHPVLNDINIFAGTGGAFMALITPALPYDFPSILFIFFFVEHGITFTISVYRITVLHYYPRIFSLLRIIIILNITGLIILLINFFLKSNYFFLMHKPPSPTLFDFLGEWPYYILVCEGIAIVTFTLIFFIIRLINRNFRIPTKNHHYHKRFSG